jgi:hypothetical protein
VFRRPATSGRRGLQKNRSIERGKGYDSGPVSLFLRVKLHRTLRATQPRKHGPRVWKCARLRDFQRGRDAPGPDRQAHRRCDGFTHGAARAAGSDALVQSGVHSVARQDRHGLSVLEHQGSAASARRLRVVAARGIPPESAEAVEREDRALSPQARARRVRARPRWRRRVPQATTDCPGPRRSRARAGTRAARLFPPLRRRREAPGSARAR